MTEPRTDVRNVGRRLLRRSYHAGSISTSGQCWTGGSLLGGDTVRNGTGAWTFEKGNGMAVKALSFDVGDFVVYPKHGVGRVVELQSTEIAGTRLDLYVLRFEKERMTLRVPVAKADSVGMRKLSSDKTMKDALETLKGKPKVKRTMWSRRAQEYEAKINSGDLVSIAEVTRDLFRADDQPEQSYSERQIFEAATSRLARELAAMEKTDEPAALEKILGVLRKFAPQYYESAPTEDA